MSKFPVNIRPDSSILATFKNQSYKIESAFAEFVDNSTQSFFTNREALNRIGQSSCNIDIEVFPEYIKIYDNAFGMEIDDFRRALKLDSPPEDKSGRSEKGMGLKTSATCLGSLWMVETTQYGSNKKYIAQVDVDEIQRNAPETIDAEVIECDENEHYTIIKIQNLHKKITSGKIETLAKLLGEMYSIDIRKKDLFLTINKQPIVYTAPDLWVNAEDGSVYRTVFEREFEVDGKQYKFDGWVGILSTGDTAFAGFNIFRKGRAIKMNYRPTQLVGRSNSFPYQRIIGEVYLKGDNWEPSYTKDELMWEGAVEERFIKELGEAAGSIIKKSAELRKEDRTVSKEHQKQIATNVVKSFKTVNSEEITSIISKKDEKIDIPKENLRDITTFDDEFEKVEINIQDVIYTFNVKFLKNEFDNWIDLSTSVDGVNEYELKINYGLDYFKNYTMNKTNLELMQKIAITICISLITAKNSGDPDAYKILQLVNSIVRSAK